HHLTEFTGGTLKETGANPVGDITPKGIATQSLTTW
ncbi:unnamed protein product, partial [marine sediment metagenome]